VIVSGNEEHLLCLVTPIKNFLAVNLKLEIHPCKISIRKFCQGIDFLGYVLHPKYRLLRTKTQRRISKKLRKRVLEYKAGLIGKYALKQSLSSFFGVLSHADTYKFQEELLNQCWFWLKE